MNKNIELIVNVRALILFIQTLALYKSFTYLLTYYGIHSSKKHRLYESHKVNNAATKQSLCPGNGVFGMFYP